MLFQFHLHYRTIYGENIGIQYCENEQSIPASLFFHTFDGENWYGSLDSEIGESFTYQYAVFKDGQVIHKEWGPPRTIEKPGSGEVFMEDKWRPRANEKNAFLSTAFTKAIFRREGSKISLKSSKNTSGSVTFRLVSATVQPDLVFGITGNVPELGDWKTAVKLDEQQFPLWKVTLPFEGPDLHLEYKYVIMDPADGSIRVWEEGDNRVCHFVFKNKKGNHPVITDDHFRFAHSGWRGAGVAMPVFSLRSEEGFGIGEFNDLIRLTDWTCSVGMNVIQVLPVNDTIANKSWTDSYPYAAISVFALHPLYIHLPAIGGFSELKQIRQYEKDKASLNKLESVDFEKVLSLKFKYLKLIFESTRTAFLEEAESFIAEHASWLKPYALFCYLRDKYSTCNFNQWEKYAVYSPEFITEFCDKDHKEKKSIEFYYFIQYHADRQLSAARDHARSKGVVLKGDLPIGIYRYSCDAWISPELYNMDEQAGAPPDDYAVLGQNWGFPTYNWENMALDGFMWWKQRMQSLNRYFDALRIDHILGFFRIWQIPTSQVSGTMGRFNPRLPYSVQELSNFGINVDTKRYLKPSITHNMLKEAFSDRLGDVFEAFFVMEADGSISFKPEFEVQQDISRYITLHPDFAGFEKDLLLLASEVLLIVESDGEHYNPRITLNTTRSFEHLDDRTRKCFLDVYNDYYFKRHDEYWKQQALWKLPPILDASDMLICGEDLGMIPSVVPGVMKDLNIISLEIQRMPKGNVRYGEVRSYPYFSVCSPSCHDMSTIRGWWEADHENAKKYYYDYLRWYGLTPMSCTPEIVQAVVEDHLSSPSMLAIFPIQDLVGMDGSLRKEDAASEQINEPSNPKHYWRFRFHMTTEQLLGCEHLNEKIRTMVKTAGR